MTAPNRVPNLTAMVDNSTALPAISFSYGSGVEHNKQYLQAYCIDPPKDSCSLGVCPNPDVTGLGQQMSGQWVKPNAFLKARF